MRRALSALVCLAAAPAFPAEVRGSCAREFQADFQPGGAIRMRLRSGDIEIAGGSAARVRVTCELPDPGRQREVAISFQPSGNSGELRVEGGPMNGFRARIEVPARSHLFVRSPAGDLTVTGVIGDKDVELRAGDLVIEVGQPHDYARAEASVRAGDLDAPAFGVRKGGLFRSFQKEHPGGRFRLHAHLGAGDLVLR